MSLNYDLRKVADTELTRDPGTRETMIFQTMIVDMGEITAANAEEFYTRTKMIDRAYPYGDSGITRAHVQAFIGLKTNVATTTNAAFGKRVLDALRRTAAATKDA
jgi:hypothetical protein